MPERSSSKSAAKPLYVLDVPVHPVTSVEAIALVAAFMSQSRLHQIATVNPEFVMAAQRDAKFHRILTQADLCLADGIGMLMAARWLGQPLPERIAGSDFVYQVVGLAAENSWPLFLLGAAPGVAEDAATRFQARFPELSIAGAYAGSPVLSENEHIVQRINDSKAEILFVAYGAPRQDKWIDHNRHTLTNVKVAIGVGGSLDFVTGQATRAPQWLQNFGLEWMHRLYKEPWRWRRMLALPQFTFRVLISPRRKK
jgi:N-acetylglucosaminyldiphosphoundecaprenol N-acetyl-beta-D-mannosaminyltransferase